MQSSRDNEQLPVNRSLTGRLSSNTYIALPVDRERVVIYGIICSKGIDSACQSHVLHQCTPDEILEGPPRWLDAYILG